MTLEQYAYLAEIVGVIVIVASLIYLAIQTRQNTDALRAASRHATMATDIELLMKVADEPQISINLLAKSESDLTPEGAAQLEAFVIAFLRVREYAWFQYQDGILDEAAWASYASVMRRILSGGPARSTWEQYTPELDPDFVAHVNRLLDE